MNIALIGKTGSGKTTLAKRLSQEFGLEIINGGENVRKYIKAKGKDWEIAEECLKTGKIPPLEICMNALQLHLEISSSKSFIYDNAILIDGFIVFEKYHKYDYIFYLDVADESAEQRIISRARDNDVEAFIKTRNEWFSENFQNLKNFLGDRMITINANVSADAVYEQVKKYLVN